MTKNSIALHVVALVDIRAPPCTFDVVLEFDAHRAVGPGSLQAAVQFAALEEKPSPFTQRNNLVHCGGGHYLLEPSRGNIRVAFTQSFRSILSAIAGS